jgi:hypothetical protein
MYQLISITSTNIAHHAYNSITIPVIRQILFYWRSFGFSRIRMVLRVVYPLRYDKVEHDPIREAVRGGQGTHSFL